MKVSREQVSEHKTRILQAAAGLFKERGFDSVTVSEVMKAAGLTHGAFYGHFPSKDALMAEAIAFAVTPAANAPKPVAAATYADTYLSAKHRDNRTTGCAFAGLGSEAVRGSDELRRAMTESIERQFARFAEGSPAKSTKDKRRDGIATWSAMVGAMVLARIVDNEDLSAEILAATRETLPVV